MTKAQDQISQSMKEQAYNKIKTKTKTQELNDKAISISPRKSSYARAMIELRANEELKDTIVVAMPKFVGEGFNMCTIHVQYEWKPHRCSSYKVFGHVLNKCHKKIVSNVLKNFNNPRQATRGVLVGPNVSFKSTKQIYRPVSNKNGASTSGKKKQAEVSIQEVSKLNPFDALNSIENDNDLGTNGVASSSISTTPIAERIDKFERQLIESKLLLVDDDGKPLSNVVSTVNADSDSEVEEVFDEHTTFMASTGDTSQKSVNFRTLINAGGNGADVVVSKESVGVVNEGLSNTMYMFFLDKRVACPVVENYVKNTWSKFNIVKSMMTKGVVSSAHGSSPVASGSPNTNALAVKINNLERQLLDGKLMLVGDDGKPLTKVDPVNANSDSDVKVAYDETAQFMAIGGANDASLYEDEDYDIYDTYDIEGLSKQELTFCDRMVIYIPGENPLSKKIVDSDNDVIDDFNETCRFMASKHLKVTNTFMGGGGSESENSSFYEVSVTILNRVTVTILNHVTSSSVSSITLRCLDTINYILRCLIPLWVEVRSQAYKTTSFIRILNRVSVTILIINDDNPDDDYYECEDLTEEQLAFCDAFDIRLPSQTRC
ncbi:hypothetical protein Tco_0872553 [Tanacetum coccineum]